MTTNGLYNKEVFEHMLRSYCNSTGFVYKIEQDHHYNTYGYIFENRDLRVGIHRHISADSFERDNIYNLFKYVTNELDELDELVREKSREIRSGRTPWQGLVKEQEYVKYGTLDVKITKAMQKFFDPDKTPEIKDVIFNYPATIVLWTDGTKTVVKAQDDDVYDPEKGLAMAICKKIGGNKWSYYNKFKHWLKKYKPEQGDYEEVSHITKVIKED